MTQSFETLSTSSMPQCSVCTDTLLRHIRQGSLFWYCPSCRQDMVASLEPDVDEPGESDYGSLSQPIIQPLETGEPPLGAEVPDSYPTAPTPG